MLIDRVQRSDLPRQMKQQVVRHLIASAPTTSEATHFLSPSLRYDLIEKFAPQYEKIAREYMQREDGRLFHAPIPERNTPWKEPTPHSWKEVTSLLLQACSGLLATKPE
jgi:hypothetical protein